MSCNIEGSRGSSPFVCQGLGTFSRISKQRDYWKDNRNLKIQTTGQTQLEPGPANISDSGTHQPAEHRELTAPLKPLSIMSGRKYLLDQYNINSEQQEQLLALLSKQ